MPRKYVTVGNLRSAFNGGDSLRAKECLRFAKQASKKGKITFGCLLRRWEDSDMEFPDLLRFITKNYPFWAVRLFSSTAWLHAGRPDQAKVQEEKALAVPPTVNAERKARSRVFDTIDAVDAFMALDRETFLKEVQRATRWFDKRGWKRPMPSSLKKKILRRRKNK